MRLTNTNQRGNAALEAVFCIPFLVFFFIVAINLSKASVVKNTSHAASRLLAWHAAKPGMQQPDAQTVANLFFQGHEIETRQEDGTVVDLEGATGNAQQLADQTPELAEAQDDIQKAKESYQKVGSIGDEGVVDSSFVTEILQKFLGKLGSQNTYAVSYEFTPFFGKNVFSPPDPKKPAGTYQGLLAARRIESGVYIGANDYSHAEIGDWMSIASDTIWSTVKKVIWPF
ncbi:MAG: hypothetical protein EHM61_07395 [Acidobacteria bacterium]|nr:MAG: hypothetical protein EHM61_07395 [Acidobacteriota bacterium]